MESVGEDRATRTLKQFMVMQIGTATLEKQLAISSSIKEVHSL